MSGLLTADWHVADKRPFRVPREVTDEHPHEPVPEELAGDTTYEKRPIPLSGLADKPMSGCV
jgi:hypothetical protein